MLTRNGDQPAVLHYTFVCVTISTFGPGPYSSYGTVIRDSCAIMSSCRTLGLVYKTVFSWDLMFHCVTSTCVYNFVTIQLRIMGTGLKF